MALKTYILKNFFSTVTSDFKRFEYEDGEYFWHTSRIDGDTYTCMRFSKEVKIFRGTIHHSLFHENSVTPLIDFFV